MLVQSRAPLSFDLHSCILCIILKFFAAWHHRRVQDFLHPAPLDIQHAIEARIDGGGGWSISGAGKSLKIESSNKWVGWIHFSYRSIV